MAKELFFIFLGNKKHLFLLFVKQKEALFCTFSSEEKLRREAHRCNRLVLGCAA